MSLCFQTISPDPDSYCKTKVAFMFDSAFQPIQIAKTSICKKKYY